MRLLEIHLCDHCNLNCVGCLHYSPLSKEKFLDPEQFKLALDSIPQENLEVFDIIHLLGGEPLLHKDINKIIEITRVHLPYKQIIIVTNGLLINKMQEDFFNACKRFNIEIQITEYPLNSINYTEIYDKLNQQNVRISKFADKTSDTGFVHFHLDTSGKAENAYEKCPNWLKKCTQLVGTKLYRCSISAYIEIFSSYFNIDNVKNEDNIDTLDISKCSVEDINNFLDNTIPFCKYCNFKEKTLIRWDRSKKNIEEWI